jgi:hypothetical protein
MVTHLGLSRFKSTNMDYVTQKSIVANLWLTDCNEDVLEDEQQHAPPHSVGDVA